MAVLFVHGVPATSKLWRDIIRAIDRPGEIVAVDLPGLASDPPPGWVADKDRYVAWLIDQIEALVDRNGGPIHLVGHDWGCLLSLRAASLRPELLRSVAAGNAPIDPHWPLHMMWEVWLRPGIGEKCMDRLIAPTSSEFLGRMGFPAEDAAASAMATKHGRDAILGLYRSATKVGSEWVSDLERIVIPSMLLWGVRDMIVPVEIGRRMATRMGAELVELDSDHFWPYEQPEAAARALEKLWARADSIPNTILTQDVEGMIATIEALPD